MSTLLALGLLACMAPSDDGPPVELWVEVGPGTTRRQLAELGLGFAEGRDGDWLRMDGPAGVQRRLRAAGLRWRAIDEPATPPSTEAYHDVDEANAVLDDLAAAAPDIAELVEIGRSEEGREIVGLRLSATPTPAATYRLVGAHHGDERSSAEVALDAAIRLVEGYDEDPAITALLDAHAVWVIPQTNPDGIERSTRYNANLVDLNRNYGYQWRDSEYRSGDAPFSEAETRALRALHAWVPSAAGLSFHSGALNIGWVWNYTTTPTADDELVTGLAGLYAAACTATGFWQTNGADWYITYGDTTDWSYGAHGVLDFTVEVSEVKTPDDAELPALLDDHWPGVRAFLVDGHVAAGVVVDADTGLGLPATVSWPDGGHDQHTGPQGRFAHRTLDTEPVTARIQAPGYAPVDVEITPDGDPPAIALTRDSLVDLRPDPVLLVTDASTASFHLPVAATSVALQRAGEETIPASDDGPGGWSVATSQLSPGPWDLVVDGLVAPRALLVAEDGGRVRIDAVDNTVAEAVRLDGAGFGRGTRAWVLTGLGRSPQPVEVTEEADDRIAVDLGRWRHAHGELDLVLLSHGEQLAVVDVLGEPRTAGGVGQPDTGGDREGGQPDSGGPAQTDGGGLDSGAATGDTATGDTAPGSPDSQAGTGGGPSGCAAHASSTPPPLLRFVFVLIPLLSRRRLS